jgi:hypothetical protein
MHGDPDPSDRVDQDRVDQDRVDQEPVDQDPDGDPDMMTSGAVQPDQAEGDDDDSETGGM